MRKLLFVLLFLLVPAVCFAGYSVTVDTEDLGYGYKYNWHVYNVDQGRSYSPIPGLDGFFVLAPAALTVVSYSVPPAPGGNNAKWVFRELYTAELSPTGALIAPAPPSGKKWLKFWGLDEGSLYGLGTTAHFSVTTTKDYAPGLAQCIQTTYVGANEGYLSFQSTTTGPTAPVPEPSSFVALGFGAIGLGLRFKRR